MERTVRENERQGLIIDSLREETFCLEQRVSKLQDLLYKKEAGELVALKQTKHVLFAKPVDNYVTPELYLAMEEYTGPEILVTSARRRNSFGSRHRVGNAIDIR